MSIGQNQSVFVFYIRMTRDGIINDDFGNVAPKRILQQDRLRYKCTAPICFSFFLSDEMRLCSNGVKERPGEKKMGRSRKRQRERTLSDLQRKRARDEEKQSLYSTQQDSSHKDVRACLHALVEKSSKLTSDQYVGWVYLVPTVRLIENLQYCKIGFSKDLDERFKSLCSNNPHALDLVSTRALRGNLSMETTLKRLTAPYTTDGANEWRCFPPDVYRILSDVLPPYPWAEEMTPKITSGNPSRSRSEGFPAGILPKFATGNPSRSRSEGFPIANLPKFATGNPSRSRSEGFPIANLPPSKNNKSGILGKRKFPLCSHIVEPWSVNKRKMTKNSDLPSQGSDVIGMRLRSSYYGGVIPQRKVAQYRNVPEFSVTLAYLLVPFAKHLLMIYCNTSIYQLEDTLLFDDFAKWHNMSDSKKNASPTFPPSIDKPWKLVCEFVDLFGMSTAKKMKPKIVIDIPELTNRVFEICKK